MVRGANPVVGSCWACKGPVRASDSARIKDPTTGTWRRVHRDGAGPGDCHSRAEIMLGPSASERG
jgi:hypothetical protein